MQSYEFVSHYLLIVWREVYLRLSVLRLWLNCNLIRQKTAVIVLETDTVSCQQKRFISVIYPMTWPQYSLMCVPRLVSRMEKPIKFASYYFKSITVCGELCELWCSSIKTSYFVFIASFKNMQVIYLYRTTIWIWRFVALTSCHGWKVWRDYIC